MLSQLGLLALSGLVIGFLHAPPHTACNGQRHHHHACDGENALTASRGVGGGLHGVHVRVHVPVWERVWVQGARVLSP